MLIEIVIFFVGVNCGVGGGDVGYVSFSLSLSSIFVALKGGGEGEKGNIWTNKPEKNLHVNFPVDILVHTMHSLHQRY